MKKKSRSERVADKIAKRRAARANAVANGLGRRGNAGGTRP